MAAVEQFIETCMYRSRWLLAPIYLGLSLALVALGVKFFQELFHLLPQLLGATRDYVKHETGTLEEVTRQRSDSADTGQRYQQEAMISRSLIDVLARAEAYPDLKASANFLELQRAISEVEKEIAAARSTYNRRVRQLNTTVEQFPSNLMARRFAFDRQAYFQLELATERDMPLA